MDIRNIQKTGGQSYTVTLPKEWIVSNTLQNKTRIKIFQHKHKLIVTPFSYKKVSGSPICNIDFMNKKQIFRELIGYYLAGTDEIIVRANKITYEQRAAVRELTYRLIGCECMESMGNQILLRNTLKFSYKEIPEFTQKMASIIVSMFADTVEYLDKKDKLLARDVMERDVEIDRLNIGIMRSTYAFMQDIDTDDVKHFSINEAVYYKGIAGRLERIADHIVRIADYYLMIDGKTPDDLGPLERKTVKQTLHHINICRDILHSLDKKKAHQYLDIFEEFNKRNVKKKYPNKGIMDIVSSESISRISNYIANIAEETINYINIKSVAAKMA